MFMDASVRARVEGLVAEACIELFSAYGHDLAPATDVLEFQDDLVLSAVIGFSGGGLRGTCLVATNQGLLRSSCPVFCRARDWVGEIANQLIGRMKNKLRVYDVSLSLNVPRLIAGTNLEELDKGIRYRFSCDYGAIAATLDVLIAPGFVLKQRDAEEALIQEGDFTLL